MQVHHRYGATPVTLVGVLTDLAFLRARSARYGGVGAPSVSRSGTQVEVRTVRQLPMEHVPSAFRRFVGDGRCEQVDTWRPVADDNDIAGWWRVDAGRAPIALHGQHVITGDADGCSTYVVSADVKVTIPVVAAALARQVETYLAQLIASEQQFLAEWLGRGPDQAIVR